LLHDRAAGSADERTTSPSAAARRSETVAIDDDKWRCSQCLIDAGAELGRDERATECRGVWGR